MKFWDFKRYYNTWSLEIRLWHFRLYIVKYHGGGRRLRIRFEKYGVVIYAARDTGYAVQLGFDDHGFQVAQIRKETRAWARENPERAKEISEAIRSLRTSAYVP